MNGEAHRAEALDIIRKLRESGFKAYIVGGAVRDMVMGREPYDYDIATDAGPDDVERIFARVHRVGASFGVSLVVTDAGRYEVAMFRRDGVYEDGRRPATVEPADPETDAMRRDFTMNSLLYDPAEDRIIDFTGGEADIRAGIVRTVGNPDERFTEDRLRMLRAVRFAARFGFTVEPNTSESIRRLAHLVTSVSAERIGEELTKTFTGPNPGRAIDLLDSTRLLDAVLPEIAALKGIEQSPEHHPEGDAFVHTRIMLDLFGGGATSLAFAVLLHDAGKAVTRSFAGKAMFPRHEVAGAEIAARVMGRLRMENAVIARVCGMVRNHMRFMNVPRMKRSTLRRFLAEPYFDELLELYRLDTLSRGGSLDTYRFLLEEAGRERTERGSLALPEPLLTGSDLIGMGYEPGPMFKNMLEAVTDAQIEGTIGTTSEAIQFVKERFPDRLGRKNRERRSTSRD